MRGPTMGSFAERGTCSATTRRRRPFGQGSAPYPRTRLSSSGWRPRTELSDRNARRGAQAGHSASSVRSRIGSGCRCACLHHPHGGDAGFAASSLTVRRLTTSPGETAFQDWWCSRCNPFAGPKGRSGVALMRLTGPAFVSLARGRERLFYTHRNTCRNLSAVAP